jgi:hypothetical protein
LFRSGSIPYKAGHLDIITLDRIATFIRLRPLMSFHLITFVGDHAPGLETKVNSKHVFPTEIGLKQHMGNGNAHKRSTPYELPQIVVHDGNVK